MKRLVFAPNGVWWWSPVQSQVFLAPFKDDTEQVIIHLARHQNEHWGALRVVARYLLNN